MHRDMEIERKTARVLPQPRCNLYISACLEKNLFACFFFFYIPRAHAERAASAASVRVRVRVGALSPCPVVAAANKHTRFISRRLKVANPLNGARPACVKCKLTFRNTSHGAYGNKYPA